MPRQVSRLDLCGVSRQPRGDECSSPRGHSASFTPPIHLRLNGNFEDAVAEQAKDSVV